MGILSNRVEKSQLNAGDHIYSWRKIFTYSHHGIYMGNGKVVHFTRVQNSGSSTSFKGCPCIAEYKYSGSGSGSSTMTPCPVPKKCETCEALGRKRKTSGVMISCLDCFLGGGSLHRYDYNVSTLSYWCKVRGGTCTMEESGPVEVVMERALSLVEKGFGEYDVFTNNCEDFARFCKTGQDCSKHGMAERGSSQASSFMGSAAAAVVDFFSSI